MGIDLYLEWDDQTKEEKDAQYTGFDVTAGRFGYLREAYHGGPYATEVLAPEAFTDEASDMDGEGVWGAPIPAATLRERLPATLETHIERYALIYKLEITPDSPSARSFTDFVELAEAVEARTGKPSRVCASY